MSAKKPKPKKLPPFTVELDQVEQDKLSTLHGFCITNNVPASKGCIFRTWLANTEASLEFLGMVRQQYEKEKEEYREKRKRH